MIDRFLLNLYERIIDESIPAKDIDYLIKDDYFKGSDDLIPVDTLKGHIADIKHQLEEEQIQKQMQEDSKKPYKKFMFVEDGSVNANELILEMERTNPEIRVIVYRQGANRPELLDIKE